MSEVSFPVKMEIRWERSMRAIREPQVPETLDGSFAEGDRWYGEAWRELIYFRLGIVWEKPEMWHHPEWAVRQFMLILSGDCHLLAEWPAALAPNALKGRGKLPPGHLVGAASRKGWQTAGGESFPPFVF